MDNNNLEQTLIDALSRLQHADVDKVLLTDQERVDAELTREQYFGFAIGQKHFVVKASCFCEVFSGLPVAPIPNAPSVLAGLCNVRGVLVPVYQLHHEWALTLPQKPYVFCIGKGEKAVAVLIDKLPVSIELAEQDCVEDDTLEQDPVLSALVENTFLARGVPHYRIAGEAVGEQLLALAHHHRRENHHTGMHRFTDNAYSV